LYHNELETGNVQNIPGVEENRGNGLYHNELETGNVQNIPLLQ